MSWLMRFFKGAFVRLVNVAVPVVSARLAQKVDEQDNLSDSEKTLAKQYVDATLEELRNELLERL